MRTPPAVIASWHIAQEPSIDATFSRAFSICLGLAVTVTGSIKLGLFGRVSVTNVVAEALF
jgi:hypothetical protein